MATRTDTKKLRPHQHKASNAVMRSFKSARRALVTMACGTGKTLVGVDVFRRSVPRRAVLFVPTVALIRQSLDRYEENGVLKGHRIIVICHDKTTVKEAEREELPFVATDAKKIAKELRKRGPVMVFCTYKSSMRLSEACSEKGVVGFDLGMFDEAHRTAGIDSDQKCAIHDSCIPIRKRFFMTATPRISKKSTQKRGDGEVVVHSMDDESKFGKVVYNLPFCEAIEKDLLTGYQVVVMGITESMVRQWVDDDEDIAQKAKEIALVKAQKKYGLFKTLTFHTSNPSAKSLEISLPDIHDEMRSKRMASRDLWIKSVSHKSPMSERVEVLEEFKALDKRMRAVISNCRIFAEGVDCPCLDSVAFMDPMNSQQDIVQAVGRAIRNSPGKEIATIVVSVFIPESEEGNSVHEIASSGAFKQVWQVLMALKDHDNGLENFISEQARRQREGEPLAPLPPEIKVSMIGDTKLGESLGKAMVPRLVDLEPITYTEDFIWEKMCEQAEMNGGRFPTTKCSVDVDGLHWNKWSSVNEALVKGIFGLPGGSSVMKLRKSKVTECLIKRRITDLRAGGVKVSSNTTGIAVCGFGWPTIVSMVADGEVPGSGDWYAIAGYERRGKWGLSDYRTAMMGMVKRPTNRTRVIDVSVAAIKQRFGLDCFDDVMNEKWGGKKIARVSEDLFVKRLQECNTRPGRTYKFSGGGSVGDAVKSLGVVRVDELLDDRFGMSRRREIQIAVVLFLEKLHLVDRLSSRYRNHVLEHEGSVSGAASKIGMRQATLHKWLVRLRRKHPALWQQAQAEAAKQAAPKKKRKKAKA